MLNSLDCPEDVTVRLGKAGNCGSPLGETPSKVKVRVTLSPRGMVSRSSCAVKEGDAASAAAATTNKHRKPASRAKGRARAENGLRKTLPVRARMR